MSATHAHARARTCTWAYTHTPALSPTVHLRQGMHYPPVLYRCLPCLGIHSLPASLPHSLTHKLRHTLGYALTPIALGLFTVLAQCAEQRRAQWDAAEQLLPQMEAMEATAEREHSVRRTPGRTFEMAPPLTPARAVIRLAAPGAYMSHMRR